MLRPVLFANSPMWKVVDIGCVASRYLAQDPLNMLECALCQGRKMSYASWRHWQGRTLAVLIASPNVFWITPPIPQQYPDSPQMVFQDLFTRVAMEGLFPHRNQFPNPLPPSSPPEMLLFYH